MDSEGHHQDDPIVVTMYLGRSDNDALWEERNTLAVALRRLVALDRGEMALWEMADGGLYGATWGAVALRALTEVFPEDPLGERAIYDCPDLHGVNLLREELDGSD